MRVGWGGKRQGSGRKKKAKVLTHPSAPAAATFPNASAMTPPTTNGPSPIEEFDAPDDLLAEERLVWLKQAPHAFRQLTLTRASALAFERYCKVVVLERNEAKSSGVGGPNHRGLIKLVRDYETDFKLSPVGKAMTIEAAPPAALPKVFDDNDAFFGDPHARRG